MSGLANDIADACATISQAESILDLVVTYVDAAEPKSGALYGATTVLRAGIAQLQAAEMRARTEERQGGAS